VSEPLDKVIARAWDDFAPESRNGPWLRSEVRRVEVAETGNVASVPLARAAKATLHGLDRACREQDDLEPTDWMREGWTPTA
jgi:hypothetical protein